MIPSCLVRSTAAADRPAKCASLFIHIHASVSSVNSIPYFFSSAINGSLIFGVMGASIPFSEIVPSRTCLMATPQGNETDLAVAE